MVTTPAPAIQGFRQIRWVVTTLLFIFFFWMANPWHYYFLNDDWVVIPQAAKGHFIYDDLLRPLNNLSLWIDHLIWGKYAPWYHVINVLIHLWNSLLVFRLGCNLFGRFGKDQRIITMKSWLAMLLFLLYASHGEPLFWITGRGGSLSTCFFLLACLYFLRPFRSGRDIFLCCAFFLLGLLTYESVWVFPLLAALFILALPFGRRPAGTNAGTQPVSRTNRWRPMIWLTLVFAGYLLLRWRLTGHLAGDYELGALTQGNTGEVLHGAGRLLYNYSTLLGRTMLPPMRDGKCFAICFLIILMGVAVAIWALIRKHRRALLPALLGMALLIALLPATGLGIDTHTTESERFIYLPSVFWVLLIVELLSEWIPRPSVMLRICLVVILANAVGLWQSSRSYRLAGEISRGSLACIAGSRGLDDAFGGNAEDGREAATRGPERSGDSAIIYAIHVPSRYQGAPIFRMGFGEAVRWMVPGYSRVAVRVLSRTEWNTEEGDTGAGLFVCEPADPVEGLRKLGGDNLKLPEPGSGGAAIVDLDGVHFAFRPQKDMVVCWTDRSLLKIGEISGK